MSLIQTRAASPPVSGLVLRSALAARSHAGRFPAGVTTPAWTRRTTMLAGGSVILICAAAYLAWIVTGTVVPWDSKNQFYAMFRFLADALQHGEFPMWNPYHYGGYPAIADPQSLLTTPSMLLFALLAPRASMQLFDAVILAHLCFGGLCVVAFFRHRRWHAAAGVLAALIFMLGGSASARLQHTGMIISYAFFPAALLTLDITLERASYRFAVLFALFTSLMVIGRDQLAFLMAFALIARALSAFVKSDVPLVYGLRRAGPLALAGALTAGAIFVPVLLTLQFLSLSNRPGISLGVAAAGSLAPSNLSTLLVPNFFGSLDWNYNYWGPGSGRLSTLDWTDRSIDYLFAGTLPMVLVIWHGLANGRLFASGCRYFFALFIAALVYAVGRYTPVFGIVFDHMPGVALYRRPADATFLINIALAFLSGHLLHLYIAEGLPRAARGHGTLPHMMLCGAALCTVAGILGSGLAFSFRSDRLATSLAQTGIAVVFAGSIVVLLIVLQHKSTRALAAILLVALSGGELLLRNAASSLNAEPLKHYSVYAHMRPDDAAGLAVLRKALGADLRDGEHPRIEILGLDGPWQNASMVLGLEDTLGYNPLRIAAYERAIGSGQNAEDFTMRQLPDSFRGYNCQLAALLSLQYLILDRPLSRLPHSFPPGCIRNLHQRYDVYLQARDNRAADLFRDTRPAGGHAIGA